MLTRTKQSEIQSPGDKRPEALARVRPHLQAVTDFLQEQIDSFEPEIRNLVGYCLEAGGKQIRPALVFLSGWNDEEEAISSDAVRVAAIIEMVHLATLVHDDIMDAASIRRNRSTAGVKFGLDTSVLLGDALFAHSLHLAAQFPTVEVCRLVSAVTRRVCSGEIIQTLQKGQGGGRIEHYRRIVELKTAELFSLSCYLGARTGGYPEAFVDAAGRFGRHLGIAYQMYDDLLDFFGDEKKAGKTLGTDLASGKFTLPLIYLQRKLDAEGGEELRGDLGRKDPEVVQKWIGRMRKLRIDEEVESAIGEEVALAEGVLDPFSGFAPAPHLQEIAGTLSHRVGKLTGAEIMPPASRSP